MFVLGTAGHIDHGKSALVRALTGIDPDRLREEKERGMTIDLGFAWLKLPNGQELGIVDVPGHERLIKNMVAGVGGIDLALIVVDASEGVMPQTKEHLAILDLLDIKVGIAVLTKKDLVDNEWLDLVKADVKKLLRSTSLSQAPIVDVSVVTGEGLSDLLLAIERLVVLVSPKRDVGRPRLPIDRVFTIAGSGTVVTGTLVDGSLIVGQEVEIVPSGLGTRIRGLQSHKTRLDSVPPGNRVGANLVGITKSELLRGDVLTSPGWLLPTTKLVVELRLVKYLRRRLKSSATVSLHIGTTQALARVRLIEKLELNPGETTLACLSLSKPVALVEGDRFVIRSSEETLGGGRVVESHTRRQRRFTPQVIKGIKDRAWGSDEEVILAILENRQPLTLSVLLTQSELSVAQIKLVVGSLIEQGKVVAIGQGEKQLLLTEAGWKHLVNGVIGTLEQYHKNFPYRVGMPQAELASRRKIGAYRQPVLQRLVDDNVILKQGGLVSLSSHKVKLTPVQQASIEAFLRSLSKNPYATPASLIPEPDLLNLLIARNQVVKVASDVIFSASAYHEMVARVIAHIKDSGRVTVAEVRDMFHTSRKYAVALLEYLDGAKVTRRVGNERLLY